MLYGVGDNSTTFNLPNLSEKVPVGVGGTKSLAATGGAESVEVDLSHFHGIGKFFANDNMSFVTRTWAKAADASVTASTGISGDDAENVDGAALTSGTLSTTTEITDIGGADLSAVNVATLQPYIAMYYIVKAL